MGTMTLENFRTEMLFDLKNRTDTGADGLSTARQDLFINSAYLHVTHPSVFRHREMQYASNINLFDGTSTYPFSPDTANVVITAIRGVTHISGPLTALRFIKLLPKDQQWFLSRSPNSGAPREYFIQANEINLNPIPGPNETGTLLALATWREPDIMVAGSTTVLSSMWDEIILLAARWRAELHLGYREMAEATKLDWVSLVNEYAAFEQLHGEDWDFFPDIVTQSPMERA